MRYEHRTPRVGVGVRRDGRIMRLLLVDVGFHVLKDSQDYDSAKKPLGMLRQAHTSPSSVERKILKIINLSPVRPEPCRRVNASFLAESDYKARPHALTGDSRMARVGRSTRPMALRLAVGLLQSLRVARSLTCGSWGWPPPLPRRPPTCWPEPASAGRSAGRSGRASPCGQTLPPAPGRSPAAC